MKRFLKQTVSLMISAGVALSSFAGLCIAAEATENIYSFTEDFSEYTAENSVTTETDVYANQVTLATAVNGAKWVSSKVDKGYTDNQFKAYIDTENQNMQLRSVGGWLLSANLDFSEANDKIEKIKGLKFKTTASSNSRLAGMKMFVSSDEKTYIFFGKANHEFTGIGGIGKAGTVDNETALKDAGPRVMLVQNGAATLLNVNSEELGTTYEKNVGDLGWWYADNEEPEWTIEIGDDGVISWSMKGQKTYAASGTIDNETVKALVSSEYAYPAAAMIQGNNKFTGFDDIELSYTKDESILFTEDFSEYTAENSITTETDVYANQVTLATAVNGAKWVSSKVDKGYTDNQFKAYIDTENQNMQLRSVGGWLLSANLDFSEANDKIEKIKGLKFKTTASSNSRLAGMKMFVSSDEKTYIFFGKANHEFTGIGGIGKAGTVDNETALKDAGPRVMLVQNGAATLLNVNSEELGTTYEKNVGDLGWWYADNEEPEWTIEIGDDGVISWSMKGQKTYAASGTIDNETVKALVSSEYAYPAAAMIQGNNKFTGFDDIEISYIKDPAYIKPTYNDLFDKYTSETAQTEAYDFNNGKIALATPNSHLSWITSDIYMGGWEGNYAGKAYVDTASRGLKIKGMGDAWKSTVNLKSSDRLNQVSELKFQTDLGGATAIGMNICISDDEKNYIMFGQKAGGEKNGGVVISQDESGNRTYADAYVPYIKVCVNGTETVAAYSTSAAGWSASDKIINWDIKLNGNVITYTATGSTGSWTGIYTDESRIIEKAYYPCALMGTGDGYGSLNSVSLWYSVNEPLVIPHKNYTYREFEQLYNEQKSTDDKKTVLTTDISDVVTNTAKGTINIGKSEGAVQSLSLLGSQIEFSDEMKYYDALYDENGNLKKSYTDFAKSISPIPSFRIGGSSSNINNMWKSVVGEASEYVSLPENNTKHEVGQQSAPAMKMGLVEWLKAIYANNPDADVVLCVSLSVTSPEDTGKLIHFLTDTTGEYAQMRADKGLSSPVKIKYVQLHNEPASSDEKVQKWYLQTVPKHIEQVKAANSDVKIMISGPTTYSNSDWEPWLNAITKGITVDGETIPAIINDADAVSVHTYIYGETPENYVNTHLAATKKIIDAAAPDKDIKLSITEHGKIWEDSEFGTGATSSHWTALSESLYVNKLAKLDYIDGAYTHQLLQTGGNVLWARWLVNHGEFYESGINKAYGSLISNWASDRLPVSVSYEDGTCDSGFASITTTDKAVEVNASKQNDGTVKLVMVNQAGYTDVDFNIDSADKYMLVKSEVYSAPNLFIYPMNKEMADLATVTVSEDIVNDFSSYTLPAKSMVVLTLKTTNGESLLSEEFSSYSEKTVSGETGGEIASDSIKGTKWILSSINKGLYESGFFEVYGSAKIANGKLTVTGTDASAPMAVNYDVSGANISDISEISFKTEQTAGVLSGVKLFVNSDETVGYDFSNALSGLNGTVEWTVKIEGNNLNWTAKNSDSVKTGTITATADSLKNYAYIVSAYTSGDGTMSLDNVNVLYGNKTPEQPISYTDNTSGIDIAINPAAYTADAIDVYVAFYNGDKLVSAKKHTVNKDLAKDEFTVSKPSEAYNNAKIFLWSSMTPINAVITVE